MPERWERDLDKLDLLEPPPGLPDRIGETREHGIDRRPMRRIAIITTSFVIFALAGSFAWTALRPARTPTTTPAAQSQLPDVGQITCQKGGATTSTPRFQVQPDGVHFAVDNEAGLDEVVIVGQSGLVGRYAADIDLSQATVAHYAMLPPGDVLVGCYPDARLGLHDEDLPADGMVAMTIEDPSGSYVSGELDCQGTEVDDIGSVFEASDSSSPEDILRSALSGMKPSDAIERTGYLAFRQEPIGTHGDARLRIVREGRVIGAALVTVRDGVGSGIQMAQVCSDSGLTTRKA
jgi:hypothetical protein